MVLCFSLFLSVVPYCFASGLTPLALPAGPAITPMYDQIVMANTWLSISSIGVATIECDASGIASSTTKVEIEAKLQRSWGLFWITEETFTIQCDSYTASLCEYYAVESGHTYRIKAKITVYSGTDSESTTIKSNEVTY